MADDTPSTPKHPQDGPSELRGLDPGELLARGLHTVKPSVGAGPWEPPTPQEVGRLLPQYRIEKLIGRGGMGAVYKGIQLNLDRAVAIKLLPAEMAANKDFVTRFEREARTLAKLQHSRIVTIFDFGRTAEGHLFFVMEYIDGTDLRSILRGPGLDPEQALLLVGQLCDALQAAHREGIIHRDIKPENVLITRDGYVKLADFGLARPPQQQGTPNLTQTDLVLGTPDYMAPEQRFGATKADARSDIFALGVMLYEMLTGQTPRGVFDPPSHKVQVDVRIDEVVLKALQFEPERRYQQASELKTAVENIRTTPLPVPAPVVARPNRTRVPVYAAATAILLLLAVGGTVGYMRWLRPVRADVVETVEKAAQPVTNSLSAEDLEQILPQYVWFFHGQELQFHPDGTATHGDISGGFQWSVDRTVHNTPTVRLSEMGETPARALRSTLWFYKDMTGFSNYEHLGTWEGTGSGGVRMGLRLPPPDGIPAATAGTNPLAAQVRASVAKAKGVYDALVGHAWTWANVGDATPPSVIRFQPDGHVSGGWTWELVDKLDGHFMVDCSWGNNGRQYMVFDPSLETFDSYDGQWNCVVKGQRTDSGGPLPVIAAAPTAVPAAAAPSMPPPAVPTVQITPAPAANPPSASPAARRARQVYDAIVGYNWAWMNAGQDTPPLVVTFNWDGHVSGGWTWQPVYKTDGETVVECIWGDNGHQYLKLNEAGDAFDAFDSEGRLTVRGKRLSPVGQPVSQEELAAARASQSAPTPVSPAARRAAQIYEAIISYHWAWINVGDTKPPLVVDFNWDGHVSGGWTWEMIYKPDGETLVHCNWNGNGHQYLRMNAACDAFDAFDNDGDFKIQGKRLGSIDQPVNVAALSVPQSVPQPNSKPSKQIEPLLEPCLNAILAPLESNPQMPRVPVEKLRASLGGDAVKARTPLEKQIYQYGMAVCEALTNGMDERALTKAAALSSAQVPWLSNGSSIVNTMPLRGRDAGRAGNAIRKKQNDERNYADAQGAANSSFMESSAYKAWVAKSTILRQNVMGLYGRLVQLEAAEPAK